MIILQTHSISEATDSVRLYDYAPTIFSQIPSRKGIKKAIKRGEILVNGRTSFDGYWLKPNDKIELIDLELTPPKPYPLKLEVIYEDNDIAVINKPAGISTSGNRFRTIQNAVTKNLLPSNKKDALKWYRPAHRLDSQTSGLLIIAKTASATLRLGQQFEEKKIQKKYHAIVIGLPNEKGVITTAIDGKESCTEYQVLQIANSIKNVTLSLLELTPKTGRTHQLRIHLSELGFPILGDKLYGKKGMILKNKGLFLNATHLIFNHPASKEPLSISILLPNKFNAILKKEQLMWEKKNTGFKA